MAIALYTAKLADKISLGEKFFFFHFELTNPPRIEFVAGQYLLLNCPTTPQKRQYSIVSAPRLDHAVELLVELIPNGIASGYLAHLTPGEEITFYAPAGEFTVKPDVIQEGRPLVCIATGSGIAPIRSIVLDLLRTKESKQPIIVYWGMRYAQDLFWVEYFEELQKNFDNFQFHLVLSAPPEEWTLCRGRVTDCLSVHALPEGAEYYLCGNPHMIEDSMKILTAKGIPAISIHHEKFTETTKVSAH